jgi:hypothetical protein
LFCVKKFQGETMKQFTFDKVKSLLSLFPRFQPLTHKVPDSQHNNTQHNDTQHNNTQLPVSH